MKQCTVDGCDKAHRARGLCSTHYNQRHQAERHKQVTIACTYCGAGVVKASGSRKGQRPFCDYTCRDLHRLEHPHRARDLRSTPIPSEHPARWFGAACAVAYTDCHHCETTVCHDARASRSYCSSRCREAARHQRRKPKRAGRARVRRRDIFERDCWMCWLCGVDTEPNAKVPHPLAPTIDHVLPSSRGGTNDPDNLATAHFICNSRRGASDRLTLAPAA